MCEQSGASCRMRPVIHRPCHEVAHRTLQLTVPCKVVNRQARAVSCVGTQHAAPGCQLTEPSGGWIGQTLLRDTWRPSLGGTQCTWKPPTNNAGSAEWLFTMPIIVLTHKAAVVYEMGDPVWRACCMHSIHAHLQTVDCAPGAKMQRSHIHHAAQTAQGQPQRDHSPSLASYGSARECIQGLGTFKTCANQHAKESPAGSVDRENTNCQVSCKCARYR